MGIVSFAAGFVAGWFVRSTVGSSRELAVEAGSGFERLVQRLRRTFVAEREFLEDLWAEARERSEGTEPFHASRSDGEIIDGEVSR